jgi:hypothetical protein
MVLGAVLLEVSETGSDMSSIGENYSHAENCSFKTEKLIVVDDTL